MNVATVHTRPPMFRQFCKVLIIILPGPGGLCSDVVTITLNLDSTLSSLQQLRPSDQILEGLAGAVEKMAERNLSHLMIYYAGHAFVRRLKWSTRLVTGENQSFHLESSVQQAIQDARNRGRLGSCKVVHFVDACMEIADDEASNVSGSEMSNQEDEPMQYFAYSVSRGHPQADNGLFATVLAYCLTCRVPTLSMLFRNLKALVSQLSCWRQTPHTSEVGNDIEIFPRARLPDIQWPMTEMQRDRELFKETNFLSKYLSELAIDKLWQIRGDFGQHHRVWQPFRKVVLDLWFHKHQEKMVDTLRMLLAIASVFEEKMQLIKGWAELELIVECPDDLECFLEKLRKFEQPATPGPEEPNILPQDIRGCLVDALKATVKDDYDHSPTEGTYITDAIRLVRELQTWFAECKGMTQQTEEGPKQWKYWYPIVGEDEEVATLPESRLKKMAEQINDPSSVLGVPCRAFLAPGSLWIIIRSQGPLQVSEFLKSLQQKVGSAICKAIPKLMCVPIHTAPRRLLHLVRQVENLLEPSRCLWLRTFKVQELARAHLNQGRSKDAQLHPSQLILFEDSIEAKRLSWLFGCI